MEFKKIAPVEYTEEETKILAYLILKGELDFIEKEADMVVDLFGLSPEASLNLMRKFRGYGEVDFKLDFSSNRFVIRTGKGGMKMLEEEMKKAYVKSYNTNHRNLPQP